MVENKIGRGTAYYFGAGFSTSTATVFLSKLGFAKPYGSMFEIPEQAELAVRSKDNTDYYFVLNYMPYTIELNVRIPMEDVISGTICNGKCKIDKYGVLVLKTTPDYL